MECAVDMDKIVIVNLEHAYALSEIIKIEPPEPEEFMITDEVVIKSEETNENDIATEEVTIKTEFPEHEFEDLKSMPCTNQFEPVVVKPEVTESSNLDSEPSINLLLEQKTNLTYYDLLIKQQQQACLAKELKMKKLVQDLQKENKALTRKNQILKHTYNEYQQKAQSKIDTLLDKNYALQSELNEFYEMKKNYKFLEDQILTLTKKMAQFMVNTLPKLSSEGIIGELHSQIDIRNKQHECVEFRLQTLKKSVERLKQVTAVVKTKQEVELLQEKEKEILENQEKRLKDIEKMTHENLVLQNDLKIMMDKYQKIKKKYNHLMLQKEDQIKHIIKLQRKLQEFNKSQSEMKIEKASLIQQIQKFKLKIVRMKNKICDYCGM